MFYKLIFVSTGLGANIIYQLFYEIKFININFQESPVTRDSGTNCRPHCLHGFLATFRLAKNCKCKTKYHVNHVDDQDDYVNIQQIFDDQSIIQKIKYKENGCDVGRYYLNVVFFFVKLYFKKKCFEALQKESNLVIMQFFCTRIL